MRVAPRSSAMSPATCPSPCTGTSSPAGSGSPAPASTAGFSSRSATSTRGRARTSSPRLPRACAAARPGRRWPASAPRPAGADEPGAAPAGVTRSGSSPPAAARGSAARPRGSSSWPGQQFPDRRHSVDGLVVVGRLRDQVEFGAARGGVGSEELGDVVGGAVGAVALEALERDLVEGLHGRRQAGAGGLFGVRDPAPHLHGVTGRRVGTARSGGLPRRELDRGGEAPGGDPDAEPAIAEPAGPPDRRVRAATDDDRNRNRRGGSDESLIEVEELAVEGDRLTGQQ